MDTKSKIYFTILFFLILGSVAFSYYKFLIVRDYFITAQAECDPSSEACFTHVCDPEAEEECTGNQEEDTSYYTLIRRNAMYMPVCNPSEEGCEALTCPVGEPGCEMTFCDEETLAETEENAPCNDPTQYVLDHPIEEEESAVDTETDEVSAETGTEGVVENGTDLETTAPAPEPVPEQEVSGTETVSPAPAPASEQTVDTQQ